MIVDDEILVRVGLRSTISWHEHGFVVVADAGSGEEAIEKFNHTDPDIMIVDIRMPGMDGIELIKILKTKKPGLKTIILTNYDDFEYARQAMKLGVNEYLLKTTLDNQTILPVLKKFQKEIQEENRQTLEFKEMQKQAALGFSLMRKYFGEQLVSGKISPQEMKGYLKELNLDWEGNLLQLVLLKSKNPKKQLLSTAVKPVGLLEEITNKIPSTLVWEDVSGFEWLVIYSIKPKDVDYYSRQVIPFNIRQVQTCFKQYLRLTTLAVFSRTFKEIQQIPEEFNKLRKYAEYRVFWPEKEMLFPRDIPSAGAGRYPLKITEKIENLIYDRNQNEVEATLNVIFEKVIKSCSPELLNQVCLELLGMLYRFLGEFNLSLHDVFDPEEQIVDFINRFASVREIKDWFLQKINFLIQQIAQADSNQKYSFAVQKAISYIKAHYQEDIKLSLLARQVGLSKNHLCTLFRRETGFRFVDFLHQVRIDRACQLLLTTGLRVSEIAACVGYRDAKYFSKVFQKYKNISPSEYRRK